MQASPLRGVTPNAFRTTDQTPAVPLVRDDEAAIGGTVVRSACDSERPTTVTHGQSWSLDGDRHESAQSAFALVKALESSPKLVVRGGVELSPSAFQAQLDDRGMSLAVA